MYIYSKYKFVLVPLFIALFSILTLPVFTYFIATPMLTGHISRATEDEALKLAFHLRSMYQVDTDISDGLLVTEDMKATILKVKGDFELLKVKVFDRTGAMVYSTKSGDTDDESRDEYFSRIIEDKMVRSELLSGNETAKKGWPLSVTDVVEAYVPIDVGGRVLGVYEIYYDVTQRAEAVNSTVRVLYLLMGTITLVLLGLVCISTSFILRSVAVRERAEEALRQALDDKDLLFKEMHHRVKNNLSIAHSLLSLQADRVEDERVGELFAESANRLMSLSLVHEMLYKSSGFKEINFAAYLRSLVSTIFENLTESDSGITLEVEADELVLVTEKVITCGLIVNELVSNSIKHAFPEGRAGNIRVGLKKIDEASYVLSVKDDGVGLPDGVDVMKGKTLGVQIIGGLVRQLDGKMDAASNICDGHGACFAISFDV